MRNEADAQKNSTLSVKPMPWRALEVKPLDSYRLFVRFRDGLTGHVDMSNLINGEQAGVFSTLRDNALFMQVFLENGIVSWPHELDLAPDAMYNEIKKNGEWILR